MSFSWERIVSDPESRDRTLRETEKKHEVISNESRGLFLISPPPHPHLFSSHLGVLNYDRVAQTLSPLQKFDEGDKATPKDEERFRHFARFLASAEILTRKIAGFFPNMESRAELVAAVASHFRTYLPEDERAAARRAELPRRTLEQPSSSRWEPAQKSLLPTRQPLPRFTKHILEPAKLAAPSPVPEPVAEHLVPEPVVLPAASERVMKPRTTPRQTRSARKRYEEEPEEEEAPPEPVYFSFSQGRQAQSQPIATADTPRPYAITPTRPRVSNAPVSSPYVDVQEAISEDVSATVYEYFQKFGLSICNYTGSCCVKRGVRFSLAFKVSAARLESSLPEVTDSFGSVLKAMKKIIMGSQSAEPAREFLLHSAQVMDAVGRADPALVNSLPKITADALLLFSKDPEGRQQLVTGYQQFCDLNNCLEKCWLEAQRT